MYANFSRAPPLSSYKSFMPRAAERNLHTGKHSSVKDNIRISRECTDRFVRAIVHGP